VLVGGLGTRLRPLTLSTPKQMLPVAGLPMIERVLGHLHRHGVDEAVLSLGYRPDAFSEAYPDDVCAGVRLVYAVEPEPLDTAGAVRFAAIQAGVGERFIVVNGDVLTDFDLSALIAAHDTAGAEGTIYLTRVDDPSHFGVVPTDADGRVMAFVEKPPRGQAPTDLVNAGFYVLEPSVLDRIPGARRVNIERETFPAMVDDGVLFARADDAYWIDVGTPERYLRAALDHLPGRGGRAAVDGEVVVPALLGDGVAVEVGAVVSQSVLERDVAVGDGSRVHGSLILPRAKVGAGAVVSCSIVGAGALVGDGATVEALSVVGDGVVIDPGAHVSGRRVPDVAAS